MNVNLDDHSAKVAPPIAMPQRGFEPTEQGTMRRLIAHHGEDLMYMAGVGRWRAWDGTRWADDITGHRNRWLKDVVDGLLDQVRLEPDVERRKALAKHWQQAQTARVQRGILTLAETEAAVVVTIDQLDRDPYALNVLNGTIDLRSGRLRPHRRTDLITKIAPVYYDPHATCPRWNKFVAWACCADLSLVHYLQRLAGYSLTGDVSEHLLAFCHGGGANGKTTFLRVLQQMQGLGGDGYALQGAPRLLVATRHPEHPTELAELVGRRLVVCSELDEDARLDEAKVKQLTGGDPVKGRFMRGDFFTFEPTGTFWLAANHKPRIRGTDKAIWRRVKLIPFLATVADDERDLHLADTLAEELPGILNWALAGCLDWQRDGLAEPAAVRTATDNYRAEQDAVTEFLVDKCDLTNPNADTWAKDLYARYCAWCTANGEPPLSQKALKPHLLAKGLTSELHTQKRVYLWHGIALIPEDDQLDVNDHSTSERRTHG